jgi:hypothetical protein
VALVPRRSGARLTTTLTTVVTTSIIVTTTVATTVVTTVVVVSLARRTVAMTAFRYGQPGVKCLVNHQLQC